MRQREPAPKLDTPPLSSVMDSNEKSTGEITAGQAPSIDSGSTPEINQPDVQANATSWSPSQRPDSAHATHTKIFNVRLRSSKHPRYVDVKTRLIALWHQSLRHEKSRGGTCFRTRTKGQGRKSVTPPRGAIDAAKTPTATNIDLKLNPQMPSTSRLRRVQALTGATGAFFEHTFDPVRLPNGSKRRQLSNFVDQQDAQRFRGADQKAEWNRFLVTPPPISTKRSSRAVLVARVADDQRPDFARLEVEERIPQLGCRYQAVKRVLSLDTTMVCQSKFTGMTRDDPLRLPVFIRIRKDKECYRRGQREDEPAWSPSRMR